MYRVTEHRRQTVEIRGRDMTIGCLARTRGGEIVLRADNYVVSLTNPLHAWSPMHDRLLEGLESVYPLAPGESITLTVMEKET